MGGDLGQPFAEDAPLAGGLVAKEAPRSDPELDENAMPGQVVDRAGVAAVHPGGVAPAKRAARPARPERGADAHAPASDAQALEVRTPLGSSSWAATAVLMVALLSRLDGAQR
jgi:hypothetical protein